MTTKTKFSVWYMKPDYFPTGILGAEFAGLQRQLPDVNNLDATHIHLKDLELPGGQAQLERVFHVMQGEIWSPNGEARFLIRSKGLAHTSMSVGDIVVVNNEVYMVDVVGFKELGRLQ